MMSSLDETSSVEQLNKWLTSYPPIYYTEDEHSLEAHWPDDIKPYPQICDQMSGKVSFGFEDGLNVLADQETAVQKIGEYRRWLINELDAKICINETQLGQICRDLDEKEKGTFLSCLTYLAHSFRWGTVPVTKTAQAFTSVDLPWQILSPMTLLNNHFGLSNSGSCWSIMLCNTFAPRDSDPQTHQPYKIRYSFGRANQPDILEAETILCTIFTRLELLAVPMYQSMLNCIFHLKAGDFLAAGRYVWDVIDQSQAVFDCFSNTITPDVLDLRYFMPYAQGPHGWDIDGDDGSSGVHALCIIALDVFFDIKKGSDLWQETQRHRRSKMTSAQRLLLDYIERENPSTLVKSYQSNTDALPIAQAIAKGLIKLKNWRLQHRKAIMRYYHDRPERNPMTAGGGQMTYEKYGTKIETANDMVCFFTKRIQDRIDETTVTIEMLAKECPASKSVSPLIRRSSSPRSISPSPSRLRSRTTSTALPVMRDKIASPNSCPVAIHQSIENPREMFKSSKTQSRSMSALELLPFIRSDKSPPSKSECTGQVASPLEMPKVDEELKPIQKNEETLAKLTLDPSIHTFSLILDLKSLTILISAILIGILVGRI